MLKNFTIFQIKEIMKKSIKIGSDFSGVGAFNQALIRLGIEYDELFACDWDKYARQTFELNYGAPKDFPKDVYEREIPKESLDIYMTSPPCQAFSLAGKRKGEDDKRGVLFYNSHEFIQKNKPRYFIIENVKGLLSDDCGKTFQRWIDYLGGKTVNGNPVIFPHEESVPYHVYYQVLNAKHYGIPQNRERIFIIGIRDDADNSFSFPKPFPLEKRLKDVLESEVDEKYFLSDKIVNYISKREGVYTDINPKISRTICSQYSQSTNGSFVKSECKFGFYTCCNLDILCFDCEDGSNYEMSELPEVNCLGNVNPSGNGMNGNVFSDKGISPTLTTNKGEGIKIGTWRTHKDGKGFRATEDNNCPTIPARAREDGSGQPVIKIGAIRRLTPTECMRLMDFNEDMIERTINAKKYFYFQFIYNTFAINKQEILCDAKLKVVKEQQTQENLGTYVLCTTKEFLKMELLMTSKHKNGLKIENKENLKNVNFAIAPLVEMVQKECVINITKWIDCTETPYIEIIKKTNQVVVDISDMITEKECIEPLWKITLEENLSEEKLFITLILLKQIMKSKIYTYVQEHLNTPRYINSIVNYEKKSGKLQLSYLRMESTKQLISDSMLYKQCGNSICVGVLAAIIKNLKL
jgi:DNA-cytosine methyltransferase